VAQFPNCRQSGHDRDLGPKDVCRDLFYCSRVSPFKLVRWELFASSEKCHSDYPLPVICQPLTWISDDKGTCGPNKPPSCAIISARHHKMILSREAGPHLRVLYSAEPRAAHDLLDYARRLRFAPSLIEECSRTLMRSIESGDGALWTDSLLVDSITMPDGRLRSLFERFPGYRTSTLSRVNFRETLATQHLIVTPAFQSTLSEQLLAEAYSSPEQTTVERVLEIELRTAVEDYRDRHRDLAEFSLSVSDCIREVDLEDCHLNRMAHLLEDIVVLSLLTNTHPFDSLSHSVVARPGETASKLQIALRYRGNEFSRRRRKFYFQLRDAANVPVEVLTDSDLINVSRAFSIENFRSVCDSISLSVEEIQKNAPEELRANQYYAAALLWAAELPVSLLVERLATWRPDEAESLWPLSKKVLLSVGENSLEVGAFDMLAPMGLEGQCHSENRDLKRILADVGIWTPSPVWTDSVLERLEHLLSTNADEQAFQFLFEAYPDFILDELHSDIRPQVMLFQEQGPTLRPDFAIRRHRSTFIDLVELKRPTCKVITGTSDRPRLSNDALDAIAQLKHYREWFRSAENRREFRKRYGLDGYEPRLTLVIGRRSPIANEEVWARALSGTEATIITYDDIVETARQRRRWVP